MHRYPATRHTANFTADLIVESRALREQFREARGRFVLARNEALQRIAEVKAAIANAEHNDGADIDELKVKTIYVEQGATLKRFSARAKGRGNRISKGTCHIYVTVGN